MAKIVVRNKDARYNYTIIDTYQAGIVLDGWEVKSIRLSHANLKGAFCQFKNNELFVMNMQVNRYMHIDGDELRERKLLLTKHELKRLQKEHKIKGLAIIPLTLMITKRNYIKLEIALARGKTQHDKRQIIKKRDQDRQIKKYL